MMCRLALAGGALLLALTGCSGGSTANNAAATSSAARTSASSAAATTSSAAVPAGGAFCDQARTFIAEVQATTDDTASPQRLQQTLPTLADQLKSITPPPPIAADWQQAVAAIQQLAQAFQSANPTDPQQLAQLSQKVQPAVAQLSAAGQHIEDYLKTQCGITAGSTG